MTLRFSNQHREGHDPEAAMTNLVNGIKTDALGVFAQKAGDALVELEQAIGSLPEDAVNRWNEAIKAVIESQF